MVDKQMKLLHRGLLLVFILYGTITCAQQPFLYNIDDERPSYGVYGDVNLNWHTANFTQLPDVPNCCPGFQSGSGVGESFGLYYEHPISRHFSWQLRAGYSWDGATLTTTEPTTFIVNNAVVPGQFTYTLDGNIATVGLEPYLKYNLRRFSAQIGFRAGYVVQNAFSQQEEITQPPYGTYSDSQRTRNVYSGALPDGTKLHFSVMSGISYEFPMNHTHTLFAAPEVQLGLGLTPMVTGLTWNANVVRLGISIRYMPEEEETLSASSNENLSIPSTPSPSSPAIPAPPSPPEKPALAATVNAVGVDADGTGV